MDKAKTWKIEDIEEISKEVYSIDLTYAEVTLILKELDTGASISGEAIVWETIVDFVGEFLRERSRNSKPDHTYIRTYHCINCDSSNLLMINAVLEWDVDKQKWEEPDSNYSEGYLYQCNDCHEDHVDVVVKRYAQKGGE